MVSSPEEQKEKTDGTFIVRDGPEESRSSALTLSLVSVSAALYVVAIGITASVSTPWIIGHFRPGVVVPAFFAVVFGPLVGGAGAAIGCFLGDCFFLVPAGLTTPLLSIVAGVTGNFVGFYLLGWLVSKRHSMDSFILSTFIALIVGNLIAASGVLVYFWFIDPNLTLFPMDLSVGLATVTGLTFYWVITMIIFVVPLVPVLVRYCEPILARIGIKSVMNLSWSNPKGTVIASTVIALTFVALYVLMVFVPGWGFLLGGNLPPEVLLLDSVVVFVSGLLFANFREKIVKTSSSNAL
jgi:hypothetical protein